MKYDAIMNAMDNEDVDSLFTAMDTLALVESCLDSHLDFGYIPEADDAEARHQYELADYAIQHGTPIGQASDDFEHWVSAELINGKVVYTR